MENITNAHNMRMGQANHGLGIFIASLLWGPLAVIIAALMQQDAACKKSGIIVFLVQSVLCAITFGFFLPIAWLWSIFIGFKVWQNSK